MLFSKSFVLLAASYFGLGSGAAVSAPKPIAKRATGIPVLGNVPYPNTTYAGVTVIDTPLVRAAIEFTRQHSSDAVFRHQMRAWLFGSLIIAGNETLRNSVDIEVQALSALLHDLGWDMDPDSPITTKERRFEVDGAIAARKFIEEFGDDNFDQRRLQLVWDAIALHTTRTIGYYKEYEVQVTSMGISVDYDGLKPGVTNESFHAITTAFPNFDLKDATNDTFTWFCATKPDVTYDTNLQPWGERYLSNYTTVGKLRIDHIFENL
ncbi:hypothetical protein M426DRAFT_27946 [Hypoxylon sp. CI-4A]|nr:hypothetical protein M426DRAFT_27946 [Hypoxylon sp. CI-4A]